MAFDHFWNSGALYFFLLKLYCDVTILPQILTSPESHYRDFKVWYFGFEK